MPTQPSARSPATAPAGRPARRRVRLRQRLLLLLGAVAVTLVVAELALRLLNVAPPNPPGYVGQYADRPSDRFVSDDAVGWRMRPGLSFPFVSDGREIVYRACARGFRVSAADPAAPTTPAATPETPAAIGARRIVVAGDSNTWGLGVTYEETWGAVLARELGDAAVTNLGQPGYGVDQIWRCLRRFGLGLDPDVTASPPDLVVVGVVRDDFGRSLVTYRHTEGFDKPTFVIEDGALRHMTSRDRAGPVREWFDNHSHLWTAWDRAMIRVGHRFGAGRWWQHNRAILDAIRADCAAAGARLVFVHLPEPGEGEFHALASHLAAHSTAYVEPLRHPRPDEPIYLTDHHLNAAGHRWVAAALLAHLRAHDGR